MKKVCLFIVMNGLLFDFQPVRAEEPSLPAGPNETTQAVPNIDSPTASSTLIPTETEPRSAKKKKRVKVGGIMQVYYKQRFERNGDNTVEPEFFRVAKARAKLSGWLTDWVSYQLEVDPRSPQLAGIMRDAFIGLHLFPKHEIRLGQQKTPWGYENMESSMRLYTVTRTEIGEGVGRGFTLRDIGIGLRGVIPLVDNFAVEDAFALVNGDGMSVQLDRNKRKNVWGRVGLRYKDKARNVLVRLGFSGGVGDLREFDGPVAKPEYNIRFRRVGADLQIDSAWFFAVGEYGFSRDITPDVIGGSGDTQGFYVLVAGKTPYDVGPVLRYESFDGSRNWTLGAYYGPPKATFRVIAHWEVLRDADARRDDRLIVATQIQF